MPPLAVLRTLEQHGTFDHLLGALKAQGDAAGHFLDKLKCRRRQVSPRSAVGRKQARKDFCNPAPQDRAFIMPEPPWPLLRVHVLRQYLGFLQDARHVPIS